MQGIRAQQKQDRRQRILEAALTLFNEQGFQATTISEIASSAGVSRGTFFNYFPYKEAVLLDAVGGELNRLGAALAAERQDGNATARLYRLFDGLALLVEQQQELVLPLSRELLHPDPLRSRAALGALPLPAMLGQLLTSAQRDGLLRSDHSPERLARVLANTFFLTALQWASYRREKPLQPELRTALRLGLEGMLCNPAAAGPATGTVPGTNE